MVILVPPEAPTTERTLLVVALTMMVGVMEDNGRLPGWIKLAGLGGTPKALVTLGDEKSSISSLRMIPVCSDVNPAPKLVRHFQNFTHTQREIRERKRTFNISLEL